MVDYILAQCRPCCYILWCAMCANCRRI